MSNTAQHPSTDENMSQHEVGHHDPSPVERAEPDQVLLDLFTAAIFNESYDNPHATALLGTARNPKVAHTVFDMCAKIAGGCLRDNGPQEFLCPDCDFKRYLDDALLLPQHGQALAAAKIRAASYASEFGMHPTTEELFLLQHDPVELVQAGLALVRDLFVQHHVLEEFPEPAWPSEPGTAS